MAHLLDVTWKPTADAARASDVYPFTVPAVRSLDRLIVDAPVTCFVGENGSGKSTLLEAIGVAAELQTIGGADTTTDDSLAGPRALAASLRLAWSRRMRRGFFLRAEDFFGYLRRRARDDARLARESSSARWEPTEEQRIANVHVDEVAAGALLPRYDARSHGESFLDLFEQRLSDGLYLLDEPEAPLSPQRQLTLLAMIADATARGAQFIIATHSPMLLAFPGARILDFDVAPVCTVAYADLVHVTLMRDFLVAPERYTRHLGAR